MKNKSFFKRAMYFRFIIKEVQSNYPPARRTLIYTAKTILEAFRDINEAKEYLYPDDWGYFDAHGLGIDYILLYECIDWVENNSSWNEIMGEYTQNNKVQKKKNKSRRK